MSLLGESFTVLAILEARDKASEIFARIDESLSKFSESAGKAAESAKTAGEEIDTGLGQGGAGADKLAAAQERAAKAAGDLAAAQRELKDAQAGALSPDADAAAQDRLAAAEKRATDAAATEAKAQGDLGLAYEKATGKAGIYADSQGKLRDANGRYVKGLDETKAKSESAGLSLAGLTKAAGVTSIGMGLAGALMVKAAGNFQDSTTHLVTDAGESQKNLAMVQAGILNVSTATGTSAKDITDAMYHIESGGFHGKAGLDMLKTAAEGAKVGGADLNTVAFALVGGMNAYKGAGYSTTQMMNALIATVGAGDLKMQDLASSLHSVAPVAAAAKLPFNEVGGAIATMTAQGMTAQQATQDLGHVISSLSNPTNVMTNEMNQFGLNSSDVSAHLGQRGLTGTLTMLTKAITDHMGKSGQVLMSAFTQSTTAGQDLQKMMATMPPQFKQLATEFEKGQLTSKQWTTALQGQTPVNKHMLEQFAALYEKSNSFNSVLAQGGPAAQTYQAALAKMTGGQVGMNVALMLSGKHAGDFANNVKTVGAALSSHAKDVQNWSDITGTFNFKVAAAKTAVENTGIAIGTALLPAATALMQKVAKIVTPIAEWTATHKKLTEELFLAVTAIAATIAVVGLAAKAFKAVNDTIKTLQAAYKGIAKLFGLVADEQAAGAAKGAAATQTAAAETEAAAGEAAAAQEAAAGEAAAAEDAAAAETSASWWTTAGEKIAASAKWLADGAVKVGRYVAEQAAGAAKVLAGWAATAAGMIADGARWVADGAVKVGQFVAEHAVAAAQVLARWAATAATMVAQGVMWVAENTAKVAVVVAENIAGALATAAAWVAANAAMLLGIGLIVVAIAAAVYLIVTHWKQISAFAKRAFDEVLHIVESVIGWIKSHWQLVLAILTGPIGLAVLWIVNHWHQVTAVVSDVIDWVRSHWPLLLAILTGPIGLAVLYVVKHFDQIKDGASHLIDDMVRFFEQLPGRILSALGDLGHLLWNAGASIINGLIGGLESQIGSVAHTASSIASTIKSFFPFSPAKQGPLSGSGDPSYSGQSIAKNMARGMLSGAATVASAARRLAGSVALGATGRAAGVSLAASSPALTAIPAGGAGGGPVNLVVQLNNPHILNENDMRRLVNQMGPALVQMLAQSGRRVTA